METKRIHCSYHKCLTVYYAKVLSTLYNHENIFGSNYRHFTSLIDDFYDHSDDYKIASVNNHSLDFSKLGDDFRISRFIRDPRDLVVSGYFYHKRGAEKWSNIVDPDVDNFAVVNGCIPENMGKGPSFSSYLESLDKESGLIAEIDFRMNHFNSMKEWPTQDPRVKLFVYEEIIGNEPDVFEEMFSFYGLSWVERKAARFLADKFSAKKQSISTRHIRNPISGQWKDHFTPKVMNYFERKHGDVLEYYGYD